MVREISIESKVIGENYPVFIVAELSTNHNQKLSVALDTIKAAKDAGADVIKIQTYTPDTMTIDSNEEYFKLKHGTIWDGQTFYELYKKAYTPWEWHEKLFKTAKDEGIICFSSPFDNSAVDLLETLNCPAYKIASFEITDIPLIEYTASKGKPMLISTGIATEEDIQLAIDTCHKAGNQNIVLLKCTSSYPAPVEKINLNTMPDLGERFGVLFGLSDHSLGIEVPLAAVALGAKVIEKHFIIDKSIGGPDASFSLDFDEFKQMVDGVRKVEKSLGKVTYQLDESAKKSREFSRSLFIVSDMKKGDKITLENVRSIRPGYGLHPKHYYKILNKIVNRNLKRGTPLDFKYIDD